MKNVILYCTDEQRADLLGCMGHRGINTPNVDALAARGAVLSRMYVQGTVCMPSRASIMTGRYPSGHGVIDNGFNLSERETTIAGLFRSAGYHTACVGRTHVSCSLPHPILPRSDYHGFAECHHSQCYWEGLDPHGDYLAWIRREHPQWYRSAAMPEPVDRDDAIGASWWDLPEELSMTSWVTDVSLEVLRRSREADPQRPLFLWAGTWDPHPRYCVPAPWDRRYPPAEIPLPVRREGELDDLPPHYRRQARTGWPARPDLDFDRVIRNTLSIYWGMISHVDDQFGRLLRGIEELGMTRDTVVVFMSDHGDESGDHWVWGKGPYWFDGSLRIPCVIASGDGSIRGGAVHDCLAEEIDVLPTLLELAGVTAPADAEIQGRSLVPVLRGESARHRDDVFAEYHDFNVSGERMFSLRDSRYRYVHYQDREYGELYDYQTDPGALFNRWDHPDYRGVRATMRDKLLNRVLRNLERADTREAKW